MRRTLLLSAALVLLLAAVPTYSTSRMLEACAGKARWILANADPRDRQPTPRVAAAILAHAPANRLPALLSAALLDRYQCRGGSSFTGTEWLIDKPALAWRLESAFGCDGLVALFASTADMQKGDIGLSRGARRVFRKELLELDERDIDCLVRRGLGEPEPYTGCLEVFPSPHQP